MNQRQATSTCESDRPSPDPFVQKLLHQSALHRLTVYRRTSPTDAHMGSNCWEPHQPMKVTHRREQAAVVEGAPASSMVRTTSGDRLSTRKPLQSGARPLAGDSLESGETKSPWSGLVEGELPRVPSQEWQDVQEPWQNPLGPLGSPLPPWSEPCGGMA